MAQIRVFQEETTRAFIEIWETASLHSNKKVSAAEHAGKTVQKLLSPGYLKVVQPALHELTTDEFLVIESMVTALVEGRPKIPRRKAPVKLQLPE